MIKLSGIIVGCILGFVLASPNNQGGSVYAGGIHVGSTGSYSKNKSSSAVDEDDADTDIAKATMEEDEGIISVDVDEDNEDILADQEFIEGQEFNDSEEFSEADLLTQQGLSNNNDSEEDQEYEEAIDNDGIDAQYDDSYEEPINDPLDGQLQQTSNATGQEKDLEYEDVGTEDDIATDQSNEDLDDLADINRGDANTNDYQDIQPTNTRQGSMTNTDTMYNNTDTAFSTNLVNIQDVNESLLDDEIEEEDYNTLQNIIDDIKSIAKSDLIELNDNGEILADAIYSDNDNDTSTVLGMHNYINNLVVAFDEFRGNLVPEDQDTDDVLSLMDLTNKLIQTINVIVQNKIEGFQINWFQNSIN